MGTGQKNLLFDLEAVASDDATAKNADKLRRVVDLFVNGAVHFSEAQVAVFDDVIAYLADRIETEVRVELAQRLAPIPNAPPSAIRRLAFDDEVAVAAPVLATSQRLTDEQLIENAKTMRQGHLMAISRRQPLAATVTDVIVERGDRDVLVCVTANPAAHFSTRGFTQLARRSSGDDELLMRVGLRSDLPRSLYLQLLSKASAVARENLLASHPDASSSINHAIARTTEHMAATAGATSRSYVAAQVTVAALAAAGKLSEVELKNFATAEKFEETTAALARLCSISVEFVERALLQKRPETILVLAKAAGHSWPTVEAILKMRAKLGLPCNLEECLSSFEQLQRSTAEKVLRIQRLNRSAGVSRH